MKNQKGITLRNLTIIVLIIIATVLFIIPKIHKNAEFNNKKNFVEELNESAVTYNIDVLKRNTIIAKYNPNAPEHLLFKEVRILKTELLTAQNIDTMINLYREESFAVMDFNDALLEYYREILE